MPPHQFPTTVTVSTERRVALCARASPDVVRETKAIRRANMRHPPILLQDAMAHFIASGAFEAHLRRMQRRYKSRGEIMLSAVTEYLPEFDLQVSQGGPVSG